MDDFVPPRLRLFVHLAGACSRTGGGPVRVDAIGSEAAVSDPVASCSGARGRRSSEVWPFGSGDGDGENDRFALPLRRVCGGDAAGGDGVRQEGRRSPGRRPSLPGGEPPSRSGTRFFKSLCAIGAPSILGAMPCFLLASGFGGDSGDGDEEDEVSRAFSEVSRDLFIIFIFVRDLCLSRLKLLYPLYALCTRLYVYGILYIFLTQ